MIKKSFIFGIEELPQIVNALMTDLTSCSLILLHGPLGAGKTTLAKALLKEYGVQEIVTSPTFTYVNVYTTQSGQQFYHFDLYRIKGSEQFVEAGFDEFLTMPNSKVLIEWPERIESILPQKRCAIDLEYYGADKRKLTYSICY